IVVTLLMAWVVSRTRTGIYVRAIYDDGESAATLGIPLSYLVVGVWALAGAILGGLESFGVAFIGSLLVGLSQGILGAGIIHLGPGLENLGAIGIVAVAVFYAGVKRRDLAHIQT